MQVRKLIEILSMFDEEMQVYTQTTDGDFVCPLQMRQLWVMAATEDRVAGGIVGVNREKLVITAHKKDKP